LPALLGNGGNIYRQQPIKYYYEKLKINVKGLIAHPFCFQGWKNFCDKIFFHPKKWCWIQDWCWCCSSALAFWPSMVTQIQMTVCVFFDLTLSFALFIILCVCCIVLVLVKSASFFVFFPFACLHVFVWFSSSNLVLWTALSIPQQIRLIWSMFCVWFYWFLYHSEVCQLISSVALV